MSKIDQLPKLVCITTENNTRIENFINQCKTYNIVDYEIYSFPRFKDSDFILNGKYIDRIHTNSKGPITSHVKAIKKWYDSFDDDYVCIVEDDINLKTIDQWSFTWSEFINILPKDWDCVQLCLIRESFDNIPIKIRPRLNKDLGCQAYLITRNYAKKIIDKYYINDFEFNFDINNVNIQVDINQYQFYDLFPIIENVLFEGLGHVYNMPLFTEDCDNTKSNFYEDINANNDECHINSYNFINNWWENIGKNLSIGNLSSCEIPDKQSITVVQVGAHIGHDDLAKHLIKYNNISFGIFVEPNIIHIDKLKECYKQFNNVVIENIAIKPFYSQDEELTIYYHDHDPDKQVASFSKEHVEKHIVCWPIGGDIRSFTVKAITIHELFDKYNLKEIDWLLLDMEGLEPNIILNLDFDKYSIKKIEFEALHLGEYKEKIIEKLYKYGYVQTQSLHEYDIAFRLVDINKFDIYNRYAMSPEDPILNLELAKEYHKQGHTASAFTHYLRCLERTDDVNLQYECLIYSFVCFDKQKNRNFTSSHLLKQAICLMPNRLEAYFYLAKHYEAKQEWYDCYTTASIGLGICCHKDGPQLDSDIVEYYGKAGLLFYKAVSAYWWDKIDESRFLFNNIIDDYKDELPDHVLSLVEHNLTEIEKKRQKHLTYDKSLFPKLRHKFNTSENIEKNYSQAYQDMFVLMMTNAKNGGSYLEIGAGDPIFGNNTYLLEKHYNWHGLSIEINSDLVSKFIKNRTNKIINADATKINYQKLLSEYGSYNIDYLQLDCEPPNKTFEILLSIPFDKYKFGIITYEHDYYLDMTRSYRDKSRNYLKTLGYTLIVNDVSCDDSTSFEDWWIHPDLIYSPISNQNNKINNIEHYFLIN